MNESNLQVFALNSGRAYGESVCRELAIPLAAVVRDGVTPIIFRRDPANPDKAIRMEADVAGGSLTAVRIGGHAVRVSEGVIEV